MNPEQAKREIRKCKTILQKDSLCDYQRMVINQYLCSILQEFVDTEPDNELWEVLE